MSATHHDTITLPVLRYFLDSDAFGHRAYASSHPGPFRWPLSPLKETEEEVRTWMAANMPLACEVELLVAR